MLAARFHENGEPFVVEEIDEPEVGDDDVLVDVKAAGVCGSDAHYREANPDFSPESAPLTMGHEGAGEVTEIGENVTHVEPGNRVSLQYKISCGQCKHCMRGHDNRCRNGIGLGHDRPGTFAEQISIPSRSVIKMSENVPYEWGGIAACAVSTAYHAVQRADASSDDTVVVFGIGGVGQHAVMWTDFFGAGKIIAVDILEEKLRTAEEFGADVTINGQNEDVLERIVDETDGWGADVSIECSGSTVAMEQCIESISGENKFASGTAVSVGLQHEPFEAATYWGLREGALMVSGDHTRSELREILTLLAEGKVDLDKSITAQRPLSEINKALDQLEDNERSVRRTILEM